jgi:hypothetical protein
MSDPKCRRVMSGDMDVPRPGGIPAASAGDGATGLKPVGSGSKTSGGREPPPSSDSGSPVEPNRPWVKVRARAKARAKVPVRLPDGPYDRSASGKGKGRKGPINIYNYY